MSNHFRRGQSKVYYSSDVWDPGEEEFARTSFRSNCSNASEIMDHASLMMDHHHHQVQQSNNDDYVASLIRRSQVDQGPYSLDDYHQDPPHLSTFTSLPPATYTKPLPLPIVAPPPRHSVLNRSAELDDILEEETDDEHSSPSPHGISSPSSNSPDGSFRLPPGGVSRKREVAQEVIESSSSASSTDGRAGTPPSRGKSSSKVGVSNQNNNNNKSQDSGFSDSAASDDRPEGSSQSKDNGGGSSEEDHALCEVVQHETRTNNKQYHVSKVYFYSVSDVLANPDQAEQEHVSILDCETGRVQRGHALPKRSASPMLSPPMSPPPEEGPGVNLSHDSDDIACPQLDPLACDINFFDGLGLEHKPLPLPQKGHAPSSNSSTQTPRDPRVHTGTSSLGRTSHKSKYREESPNSNHLATPPTASPGSCSSCRSPAQFPKTNGSLYESLSLGRRCHCDRKSRPSVTSEPEISLGEVISGTISSTTQEVPSASPSVSLPSPAWTGTAFDSFDDPISGCSRRSFRSVSELSMTSGGGASVDNKTETTVSSNVPEYSSPPSSVVFWLRELCLVHEAECTIMLQSKPLTGNPDSASGAFGNSSSSSLEKSQSGNPAGSFWAGNSKDTIRAIQSRAHSISAVFAKLCKQLGHKGAGKLVPLVQGLSHQVHLFLVEYNKVNHLQLNLPGFKPKTPPNSNSPGGGKFASPSRSSANSQNEGKNVPEEILHQQRLLLQSCDRLKLTVSRHQSQNTNDVVDVITHLGATFTKLIELMLSKEIKSSVDCLEDVKSDSVLKNSIENIINLALEGNHLCRLIAKHGGVRSLLTICVDPTRISVRVNAFRALGTVCCVLEGIMELEDAGGIEILSDTLKDPTASEDEKSEAAGLLAQVTSPWIENNSTIEGLSRHLTDLVQSLTELSGNTASAETFLLSTAALANLTFMEASVVTLLKSFNTAKVLVTSIKRAATSSSRNASTANGGAIPVSIYIQDQVAAVLANMAANADCRSEVVKHGGLPLLLQFLMASPPFEINSESDIRPEDYAQLAATERVLQKSAIAISRLCNDKKLAEEVVKLDGLGRLVELCKNENSRVGSDGVLVACLAAVRKISAAVGADKFRKLDATELVEPRLLDSFLIFSSRNESFV